MSLLIINTLQENDPTVQKAIDCLIERISVHKVFHIESMNIKSCIGCNNCWIKTPGLCALKDDYEQILKSYLQYDTIIFVSGTLLNFIDYKTKNIIDRMLPLVTMYTYIVDGQMRHISRYEKKYRIGLIYSGKVNQQYLEYWLKRFALNFNGTSIGVFSIEDMGGVLFALNNH